jgi:hypothetical protein
MKHPVSWPSIELSDCLLEVFLLRRMSNLYQCFGSLLLSVQSPPLPHLLEVLSPEIGNTMFRNNIVNMSTGGYNTSSWLKYGCDFADAVASERRKS